MIHEIQRVGDVVLQQVTKPDGTIVRYQYGRPGDASSIIHVQSLREGREAIAPKILTMVDRNDTGTVHKVTKNGKLLCYQYDTGIGPVEVPTLAEARQAIGKVTAKK